MFAHWLIICGSWFTINNSCQNLVKEMKLIRPLCFGTNIGGPHRHLPRYSRRTNPDRRWELHQDFVISTAIILDHPSVNAKKIKKDETSIYWYLLRGMACCVYKWRLRWHESINSGVETLTLYVIRLPTMLFIRNGRRHPLSSLLRHTHPTKTPLPFVRGRFIYAFSRCFS